MLPGPVSDTEEPTAACLGPRDSQQGESPVNANMLARCQIEITVSTKNATLCFSLQRGG